MDTNSWINTGIRANPQSVIYAKLSPQSVAASIDWATFWGANSSDDAGDTYQLRQAGMPTGTTGEWKPQIGTSWRTGRVGTIVYGDDYEITFDVPNSLVTINNDNYTGSQCVWGSPAANPTYPIYVGANNKANSGYRASGAKWYAFYIIQSGVKVIDLVPAIDENSVVCFYDKVSGNYFYNAGSGTFTAGPAVSSINAMPSKTVVKSTGETVNFIVSCENAWELTSYPNWVTMSATGGTGSTTISAVFPNYEQTIDRVGTFTFTDLTTTDTSVVSIKQKKYTNGQPLYLGVDTISEMYIGDAAISEAYLGDVLVFSVGTPAGGTRTVQINNIPTPTFVEYNTGLASVSIDDGDNYIILTLEYTDPTDQSSYQETIDDTGTTGITTTFSNGVLTAVGDWGDDILISYTISDPNCGFIPEGEDTEQISFTGDTIVSSFPTPETDPICECTNQGGEWDSENEECVMSECAGFDSQEECDCVHGGGVWIVPDIGDPFCDY